MYKRIIKVCTHTLIHTNKHVLHVQHNIIKRSFFKQTDHGFYFQNKCKNKPKQQLKN